MAGIEQPTSRPDFSSEPRKTQTEKKKPISHQFSTKNINTSSRKKVTRIYKDFHQKKIALFFF